MTPTPETPSTPFEERKSLREILSILRRLDLSALTDREFYAVSVLSVVALGVLLALVLGLLNPPPPRVIAMSAGTPGGGYHAFALRYQQVLRHYGVELEVMPSNGSLENLERLRHRQELDTSHGRLPVLVAFAQSGTSTQADLEGEQIYALASVSNEPVWIFHRLPAEKAPVRLSDLKGLRIGIDIPGSGARHATLQLLESAGVTPVNSRLTERPVSEGVDNFAEGQTDVLMTVAPPSSPIVRRALEIPGVTLMNFEQADGFVRQFGWLRRINIPRAALDLKNDRPSQDVKVIAATANLVVHRDLHPSLAFLLLEVAREVHSGGSAGNERGEFPSAASLTLHQSEESRRWFETGRPFLQRYMPFWVAIWIERLIKTLVPLLVLVLPLFKALPAFKRWREEARVSRIFVALRQVESRASSGAWTPAQALQRLEVIDRALLAMEPSALQVAKVFSARKLVFALRERIEPRGAQG